MRVIATGDDSCFVFSLTGSGHKCRFPKLTKTGECSSKVFVGGKGVVVEDNKVKPHPKSSDCSDDESILTTYSSKVFIGGKGVARIGDKYGSDNYIISGNAKVLVGG